MLLPGRWLRSRRHSLALAGWHARPGDVLRLCVTPGDSANFKSELNLNLKRDAEEPHRAKTALCRAFTHQEHTIRSTTSFDGKVVTFCSLSD